MVPRICTQQQGSCQAGAADFQQRAELSLFCNRGLRALAMAVLPIRFQEGRSGLNTG